jgi:hypothetical protein
MKNSSLLIYEILSQILPTIISQAGTKVVHIIIEVFSTTGRVRIFHNLIRYSIEHDNYEIIQQTSGFEDRVDYMTLDEILNQFLRHHKKNVKTIILENRRNFQSSILYPPRRFNPNSRKNRNV